MFFGKRWRILCRDSIIFLIIVYTNSSWKTFKISSEVRQFSRGSSHRIRYRHSIEFFLGVPSIMSQKLSLTISWKKSWMISLRIFLRKFKKMTEHISGVISKGILGEILSWNLWKNVQYGNLGQTYSEVVWRITRWTLVLYWKMLWRNLWIFKLLVKFSGIIL